ncbi:hypothetical protein MHA01_32530 [Marinococcus halophilus]|uniref:EamA domain-containing protein n=1 Tax=Marinococcus halophilus TaxID=1371 RepID=A0A510YAG4_MARHA|nr:hypothetical protein MHA01_32530 [Marinococcus halophilus]
MLVVQYTYMASIADGNAAVATLLQYLSPAFIMMYLLLRRQTAFTRQEAWTLTLAHAGCFLLLTNGSLQQFQLPVSAVVWGTLSGIALAFYTLYAVGLLQRFASLVVVGWGMVIGGGVLSFWHPVWRAFPETLTLEGYLYLLFVIVGGTMIAFWFYIASLNYLEAKATSLLGCLEPLASGFSYRAVASGAVWRIPVDGSSLYSCDGCFSGPVSTFFVSDLEADS